MAVASKSAARLKEKQLKAAGDAGAVALALAGTVAAAREGGGRGRQQSALQLAPAHEHRMVRHRMMQGKSASWMQVI